MQESVGRMACGGVGYIASIITYRIPTEIMIVQLIIANVKKNFQLRPYILESSGSRPISEDKLVMAQLVLWWVTTWEY